MTSGELLNKRFEKTHMGGGYRPAEVEAFLAEAATAFSQLTRENAELKRQVEALRAQTADVEADKNSLRDALLSAQKFADSLVAEARGKADTLLADARSKADTLVTGAQLQVTQQKEELVRIKTEVASFRSRLLDLYRSHLELIGAIPAEQPDDETEAAEEKAQPEKAEQLKPAAVEKGSAPQEQKTETKSEPAAAAEKPAADVPAKKEAAPAAKQQPKSAQAEAAAAAQEPVSSGLRVRLNMRFDPETGEYVPLGEDQVKK